MGEEEASTHQQKTVPKQKQWRERKNEEDRVHRLIQKGKKETFFLIPLRQSDLIETSSYRARCRDLTISSALL